MTETTTSIRPDFSILTASLNMSSTIQKTLESISCQTYRSFEHIIVDGGSNDRTIELLKKYERCYPLTWISEPDEGIADALNKGLRMATGNYIMVLQADDAFINNLVLESVKSLINKSGNDIYSFSVMLDHPSWGPIVRKPIRIIWWNRFKFIFPHQGCFVKRSILNKIGGFDTSFRIAMDYDFFYRALKHKCSVKFYQRPVTLMGGTGIGSILENAAYRLWEEQIVQELNEDNQFWRIAQKVFWLLYLPYKKRRLKLSG